MIYRCKKRLKFRAVDFNNRLYIGLDIRVNQRWKLMNPTTAEKRGFYKLQKGLTTIELQYDKFITHFEPLEEEKDDN